MTLTEGKKRPVRVFLADDHPLLRAGLRISLEKNGEIVLIGEAGDGHTAIEKIRKDPPDVSLIDIDLPGLSGTGVIRFLRKTLPSLKILVLSTYNDETFIADAMEAGADGYVLKSAEIDELMNIIKSFADGHTELSPYLVNLTTGYGRRRNEADLSIPSLTRRETQILRSLCEGLGNKEISESHNISLETVKTHIKNIYRKINAKNRVEAARIARQNSLLDG